MAGPGKLTPEHQAHIDKNIARADYFTTCIFLGRGEFDVRRAPTLEAARELREVVRAEYAGRDYCRGVMIYAVVGCGALSIHVE